MTETQTIYKAICDAYDGTRWSGQKLNEILESVAGTTQENEFLTAVERVNKEKRVNVIVMIQQYRYQRYTQ